MPEEDPFLGAFQLVDAWVDLTKVEALEAMLRIYESDGTYLGPPVSKAFNDVLFDNGGNRLPRPT